MPNRRTLHEVGVFQSLLAKGALECWVRGRCRGWSGARWCITRCRTGWRWKPTRSTTTRSYTGGATSTARATSRHTTGWRCWAGVGTGRIRARTGTTKPGDTVRWCLLGLCLRLGRKWGSLLGHRLSRHSHRATGAHRNRWRTVSAVRTATAGTKISVRCRRSAATTRHRRVRLLSF